MDKLNRLYEKVMKEDGVKKEAISRMPSSELGDPYDFFDKPLTYSTTLKSKISKIEKFIATWKKEGNGRSYIQNHEKSLEDYKRMLKLADDIVPLIKQLKKGMSQEEAKKIISKSKYWDAEDITKARGPIDLYINFDKNDKLEKWYF
jgi:uncharacterized protein YeeX (DUF496 family)